MRARWPKVPTDTEYCRKIVVVEKTLFTLSAINRPQRKWQLQCYTSKNTKFLCSLQTTRLFPCIMVFITSVLVLQIRWNSGSTHPEVNGQEKVFHSWWATSASQGSSLFQHSPAHKIHHSAWTQSKSRWWATIVCSANYSMQCPYSIKKWYFFTI